jgi:Ty3 transposon capsid-like protein
MERPREDFDAPESGEVYFPPDMERVDDSTTRLSHSVLPSEELHLRAALIQAYLTLTQQAQGRPFASLVCLPVEVLDRLTRPLILDATSRLSSFLSNQVNRNDVMSPSFLKLSQQEAGKQEVIKTTNRVLLPSTHPMSSRPMPIPSLLPQLSTLGTPGEGIGSLTSTLQVAQPERFAGSPTELTTFLLAVYANLGLRPDLSDGAKLGYVRALLKGEAADWVLTYDGPQDDFAAFMDALQNTFGDFTSQSDACNRLRRLTDTGDIDTYNASFRRLQFRAGFDGPSAMWLYLGGLSSEIQREMLYFDQTLPLTEAMATARFIGHRLKNLQQSNHLLQHVSAVDANMPHTGVPVNFPLQPTGNAYPNYLHQSSTQIPLPFFYNMAPVQWQESNSRRNMQGNSQQAKSNPGKRLVCWLCNTVGHRHQECPHKNQFLAWIPNQQQTSGPPTHGVSLDRHNLASVSGMERKSISDQTSNRPFLSAKLHVQGDPTVE